MKSVRKREANDTETSQRGGQLASREVAMRVKALRRLPKGPATQVMVGPRDRAILHVKDELLALWVAAESENWGEIDRALDALHFKPSPRREKV